jgi:hypothetical protein
MIKKLVFSALMILFSASLFAQDDSNEGKGFKKENLFVGGNFGLTFGSFTLINISPQIGYRFNKTLAAGLGINGQYISEKRFNISGSPAFKTKYGIVGLNVFGRVYPVDFLMLQVQPELNYSFGSITFYGPPDQTTKQDAVIVPSLLLGGGLVMPSGRGSFIISVFFDALQKERSPYGNRPVYNVGYNINLGGGQ